MGIKFKDIFNKKINSKNKQISFDLKKREVKKFNISVDDILNMELQEEKCKLKKW